jgi:hypothetical protein
MEARASSRYPLWTRGGVPTRMEGMQGGVWKGRARMEGRRGRRMAVGFADGDHGRGGGAREGGHGDRGVRGGEELCTVWTPTLLS